MGAVNCATCRYSAPADPVPGCDRKLLECHRNAPQAILAGGDDPTLGAWWPLVWEGRLVRRAPLHPG